MAKGQTLVNSGQYQEAVKVCRLGLLGRPTTVEGRVVLGQALLALKRYDEVLAEMRVALELDHHSFTAQRLKAEALLLKGDPHAAMEVLRRLQQQVPGSVNELLADCEIKLGRPAVSASHPSVNYVGKGSAPVPRASTSTRTRGTIQTTRSARPTRRPPAAASISPPQSRARARRRSRARRSPPNQCRLATRSDPPARISQRPSNAARRGDACRGDTVSERARSRRQVRHRRGRSRARGDRARGAG